MLAKFGKIPSAPDLRDSPEGNLCADRAVKAGVKIPREKGFAFSFRRRKIGETQAGAPVLC